MENGIWIWAKFGEAVGHSKITRKMARIRSFWKAWDGWNFRKVPHPKIPTVEAECTKMYKGLMEIMETQLKLLLMLDYIYIDMI